MRRETDGRTAVLAAAAVAAACFAARPQPALSTLEPGFGRLPRSAALPPLAYAGPRLGPAVPPRFKEVLRDDRADILDDAPARTRDERARGGVRLAAAAPFFGSKGDRAGAARFGGSRRVPSFVDNRRPREPESAALSAHGVQTRPLQERRLPGQVRPGSAGRILAEEPARTTPPPRARHAPGRRAAALREGPETRGEQEGLDERHEREAPPFETRTGPARRRVERRRAKPRSGKSRHRAEKDLRRRRAEDVRRFHPLLLSKLLGPRALRPPPPGLEPPAAPALARPDRGPDGQALPAAPAGLDALDETDPAELARDRRKGAHWDGAQYHDGDVRGLVRAGEWLWLRRDGANWWAFAGGGAQLRRDGVWWTKTNGVWFVVHDGAAWAWRSFQDWDAQGLFHPASGTEMVYSRDFRRVALITPGEGADVFDAATGERLARIPEALMPPRRRPQVPRELPLPADVFAK